MKGELKIFNFGLSAELLPEDRNPGGLYCLSMAGTLQYMAPEVLREMPYNELADVYSCGVVMWEVFVLEKAFLGWSWSQLYSQAHGNVCRLVTPSSVPPFAKTLIKQCCAMRWEDRPSFDTVVSTLLRDEYTKMKEDPNAKSGGKHTSLRSFSFRRQSNTTITKKSHQTFQNLKEPS